MPSAPGFTVAEIEQLSRLWEEGSLSTIAIAAAMGRTKNSVVGKAHRLGLTPRASPIRSRAADAPTPAAKPRRLPRQTLPASTPAPEPPPPVIPALVIPETRYTISGGTAPLDRCADRRDAIRGATLATVAAEPVAPNPAGRRRRSDPCCWPIGEPGTRGFRFCDAATEDRKPYCQTHAAKAFVRPRERAVA